MPPRAPAGSRYIGLRHVYKTIMPATDWFFVHEGHSQPVVWHLAAWALTENGQTIGLIAAGSDEQVNRGEVPHLEPVPKVKGRYMHREQLTKDERYQAEKRGMDASAPL